jgi:hypothetical protein
MRGGEIPAGTTFFASGVQSFDTGDAEIRMDYGDLLGGLGEDRYAIVRAVDGVMYMRFPSVFIEELGLSRPWLRLDLNEVTADGDPSALSGTSSQADPGQYLGYLSGVSDDVVEVGTEDVGGVSTTRYRATIDFSRALDQGTARDMLDQMGLDIDEQLERLRAAGVTIPTDVWIDEDGLLRKLRMRMGGEALGSSGLPADTQMTITIELHDYGTPVSVTAPPPEDVTDWSEFLDAVGPSGATGPQ